MWYVVMYSNFFASQGITVVLGHAAFVFPVSVIDKGKWSILISDLTWICDILYSLVIA